MIAIMLGNVGSGKTLSAVRYMLENPHKKFVSNIKVDTKKIKNVIPLTASMIIKKEIKGYKRNGEEIKSLTLNVDYWKELIQKEGQINIILDEAHTLLNARRGGSKRNIVVNDWLALLRRILGSEEGNGTLTLISQLSRRLDIIAKEMSTRFTWCISHYMKVCVRCGYAIPETNETPKKLESCRACGCLNLKKMYHRIEVFEFVNMDAFEAWYHTRAKTYYNRYMINNAEQIYPLYNTLQFDDLLSDY